MTPAEGVADHLEGRVLAERYRVGRRIGRGGMGSVYEAEHVAMKRRVALKVLRPELALDPTMVARFRREAQAASRIESKNVVTLFDFGSTPEGLLFIAMELVDGMSLRGRLDADGSLPLDGALHVALGIAHALAAAHAVGVVHRDLKPDNVMLCRDGRVLVLDFGIAKVMDPDRPISEERGALTEVGAIVGTPMYMSPEAVGRRRVGPAADLYALGIILFEMLVGHRPFDEKEPVLLMGMHLRVPAELLREARPELAVPDALEELVDRLLAKDPAERPASAAVVVEELERVSHAPSSPVRDPMTLSDNTLVESADTLDGSGTHEVPLPEFTEDPDEKTELDPRVRRPLGWSSSSSMKVPSAKGMTDAEAAVVLAKGAFDGGPDRLPPPDGGPVSRPTAHPPPWLLLAGLGVIASIIGFGGAIAIGIAVSTDEEPVIAPTPPLPVALPAPITVAPDAGVITAAPAPVDAGVDAAVPTAAGPELVEIRVIVHPAGTRLLWDGEPVQGTVLRVPRGESQHTLRGTAHGYLPRTMRVAPFDSQTVELRLRRNPWPPPP